MAKAHQRSAKSKQDALQERDYLILEQVFRDFVASGRNELDTAGLSDNGRRAARAISCLLRSTKTTRDVYARNEPNLLIEQTLDEADALLMALIEGRSHPALSYFESRRKRGRPKEDYFAVRRLEMAICCYLRLLEEGKTQRQARREIELAVRGLDGAVTKFDIENYLNRNAYSQAKQAVEELFQSELEKARRDDPSIKAIELLPQDLGPFRPNQLSKKVKIPHFLKSDPHASFRSKPHGFVRSQRSETR